MLEERGEPVLGAVVRAFITVLVAGWFGLTPRPRPPSARERLFTGGTYVREVRDAPRPVIAHVVTVDLRADGVSFLVTPGDPSGPTPLFGRTTSAFLGEYHLQAAINGDFFEPWYSNAPWGFYPRTGDPVGGDGVAASRGAL